MEEDSNITTSGQISVLIVDDSLVFRRFLGDIFQDCEYLQIIGEAENGIEALEMMLKTLPDVILLDMEMPLMDGMTALQHLMIHRPTPVIMFSSITEEGTARCFDTMKNGAVDFICKDFIFQQQNLEAHKRKIVDKVVKAAMLKLRAREPVFSSPKAVPAAPAEEKRVIFCEECGSREVVSISSNSPMMSVNCSQCGDEIEICSVVQSPYRRNNYITVLGGGEGAFHNILQIVPRLDPSMGGSVIVVLHGDSSHVDNFTEYLDAISPMKIIRAHEGVNLEGGKCYIISGGDYLSIKTFSAQMTLQKVQKTSLSGGTMDLIIASAATLFKKRVSAIFLSGDIPDGEKGVAILDKYGGSLALLAGQECLSSTLIDHISRNHDFGTIMTTDVIVASMTEKHNDAKYSDSTV